MGIGMQYLPVPRRLIQGSAVVLFLVALLTYQSPFGLRAILFPPKTPKICQWQDWQSSPPVYHDCKTVRSPLIGDPNVLGDSKRCLLARTRLNEFRSSTERYWPSIKWGQLQRQCLPIRGHKVPDNEDVMSRKWRRPPHFKEVEPIPKGSSGRVAIVLRTWDNYAYTETRRAWLRTLISEASIQGGYHVFFLVNVKDPNINLEEDDFAYKKWLAEYVPEEFRDMAFLYNENTLKAWYPLVEEHGAQDQIYQALQIFSHQFPQYDHIWQLEMDLRFTGHVHSALESATSFARAQSRRNLWERNGRFYLPAIHHSYENFTAAVDAEIGDTGIWGAVATEGIESVVPPPQSVHSWGVEEEADVINFMPTIDPVGTDWVYENTVHGFANGTDTPRRAAIVSITRSSRRLLRAISKAQREKGQWVVSEAMLETFALLQGLKAVTVPHPIVFTNEKSAQDLDREIHRGPPSNRAGGKTSMVYTNEGFPPSPWWGASYWFTGDGAKGLWEAYVEGEDLPPMLLHPVKEI